MLWWPKCIRKSTLLTSEPLTLSGRSRTWCSARSWNAAIKHTAQPTTRYVGPEGNRDLPYMPHRIWRRCHQSAGIRVSFLRWDLTRAHRVLNASVRPEGTQSPNISEDRAERLLSLRARRGLEGSAAARKRLRITTPQCDIGRVALYISAADGWGTMPERVSSCAAGVQPIV